MDVRQNFETDAPFNGLDKGVPFLTEPLAPGAVPAQRWNLLNEDIPLPAAVIKETALRHNSGWMRQFVETEGAAIAPHGKTTMCPQLFDLQMKDGAWGITLSTAHQVQIARRFGHKRIFFANQLVGKANIDFIIEQLNGDADFEFYCLVDSRDNALAIAAAASRASLSRPVNLLVELGYRGGRTGCRTNAEALELATLVACRPELRLAGIEGFEGLLRADPPENTADLVQEFLGRLTDLARQCDAAGLFPNDQILLSAGGSSYYDLVVRALTRVQLSKPTTVLLRSGCYIMHDSVMYVRAFEALRDRNPNVASIDGGLLPALEVWAYVQSRPEREKAIIAFGKRDASHDDPPVALSWFRPGSAMTAPISIPHGHRVLRLNDQHCHLAVPADSPLRVGDMISFGISHPCLTFDKWRVLHLVDDAYIVTSSMRTYF
jgi:D-serine dehydratase